MKYNLLLIHLIHASLASKTNQVQLNWMKEVTFVVEMSKKKQSKKLFIYF